MENTIELIDQIQSRSSQLNTFDAIAYANRGWAVFPLAPGTKLPTKGSHGLHDATLDREAIDSIFTPPDLNVGIRTGEISRLIVVDLDLHSEEANGLTSMAELRRQGFELPFGNHKYGCGIVRTPTGGMHLYYRLPEGVQLKSTSGVLAPGIDTRAEGGYVVAPPSKTAAGSYTWEQYPAYFLEAPEWLKEALKAKVYEPRKVNRPLKPLAEMTPKIREVLNDRLSKIAKATPGQRNTTLNSEAFYLAKYVGSGFDQHELENWLLDAARQSAMPEYEARRTIESAIRSQLNRLPSSNPDGEPSESAAATPNGKVNVPDAKGESRVRISRGF